MKSLKLFLLAGVAAFVVGCGGAPAEVSEEGGDLLTSSEELSTCPSTWPRCTSLSGTYCPLSELGSTVSCCVDEPTYSWESSCRCLRLGAGNPTLKYVCAF
ncbi:hypothetical protein ACN47A_13605 [Myxococcus fulvus]|uniref:hypothetical protein n=1 Tax=Myxococcus fulvus TaxID=33 RepID=UPI003B9BAE26